MGITANGITVPRVSPDAAILRAQDAFAAAKAAKASLAQSAYAPSAPAARPPSAPQSAAVIAQITQRAGATAAMLRQNEPNNPLVGIADDIHQTMAGANGDPFSAFGEISELQNALRFAMASTERMLENPVLLPLD